MLPQRSSILWAACITAVLSSCSSAGGPSPVARQYIEALASGRADDAWQLLSNEAKQRQSRERHRELVAALTQNQRDALRDAASQVSAGAFVIAWREQNVIFALAEQNGRWVVTDELPLALPQSTPAEALLTFHRAWKAKDHEALLSLAPVNERQRLDGVTLSDRLQNNRLWQEVVTALKALIDSDSGRAIKDGVWRFEAGLHRADFVLEDKRWRLSDLR